MIRLNNELQIVSGMKSPEKSKLWLNELKQEAFAKEGNVVTTQTCKSAISKKQKAIKEKTNSRNSICNAKTAANFVTLSKFLPTFKAFPRVPRCSKWRHCYDKNIGIGDGQLSLLT